MCDDNKFFLEEFERQLRGIPIIDATFPFSDYNALLFSIDEGKQYDAILLDIEWGSERTGLDIAEELYKLSPHSQIIYVTGNGERFSQRIFLHKSNLSGFLTKPVDSELLYANLRKVEERLVHQDQPVLVLRRRGAPVSIPIREIYFIESQGHTIEVHTDDGVTISYEKLQAVLPMLPTGFYQCHKSYIVNMIQIRRFQSSDILLKNGAIVPVSRSRYTETKEAYFSYMEQTF